jgi:NAD(P)H dehydrogenase (quinone)
VGYDLPGRAVHGEVAVFLGPRTRWAAPAIGGALARVAASFAAAEAPAARVLVVHYSRDGHTAAMADAVARGVRAVPGAAVTIKAAADAGAEDVLAADAIVVGTPVHNANPTPEILEFVRRWPFEGQPLKDKIGAAFVTAGGISAGEELVLTSLLHAMLVYGMVVVGGPEWRGAFGASAVTDEPPFAGAPKGKVDERFLAKAEALGRRVAELAVRLRPGETPPRP